MDFNPAATSDRDLDADWIDATIRQFLTNLLFHRVSRFHAASSVENVTWRDERSKSLPPAAWPRGECWRREDVRIERDERHRPRVTFVSERKGRLCRSEQGGLFQVVERFAAPDAEADRLAVLQVDRKYGVPMTGECATLPVFPRQQGGPLAHIGSGLLPIGDSVACCKLQERSKRATSEALRQANGILQCWRNACADGELHK